MALVGANPKWSHTTNKDNTVWPIIASLSQVGRP
jgi:hypothetical protein